MIFWLETPGASSAGMGGTFEARIREADAGELRASGTTRNGPVAVREGGDRETGPQGLPGRAAVRVLHEPHFQKQTPDKAPKPAPQGPPNQWAPGTHA